MADTESKNFIFFIKSNPQVLILLFVIVFGTGILTSYSFSAVSNPRIFEQERIAQNLLNNEGFVNHYNGIENYSFVSAPSVYLFYFVHKLFGVSIVPIILFQYTCSFLLGLILIFYIWKYLTDYTFVAVIVGIAAVMNPVLVYYHSVNIHNLPVLAVMAISFLCFVYDLFKNYEDMSWRKISLYGFLMGFAALERPTLLLFFCMSAVCLLFVNRCRLKRVIQVVVIILICAFLSVSIWFIRNHMVFEGKHTFHLQSCSWFLFYRGNNLSSLGTEYHNLNRETYQNTLTEEERKRISSGDEFFANEQYKRLSIRDIKKDPCRILRLYFNKMFYFFWFSPTSGIEYPAGFLKMAKIYYLIFYSLFIYGVYYYIKNKKDNIFLFLSFGFIICLAMAQSVFYVQLRHRIPIEPVMYVFAFLPIGEKLAGYFNSRMS